MSYIGTYIVPKYMFHILLDMFHFVEMLDLPEMLDFHVEVLDLLKVAP